MKFISLTDAKTGHRREVRGDLLLEMSVGTSNGKDVTFLVAEKQGWLRPVLETPEEIKRLIAAAEHIS